MIMKSHAIRKFAVVTAALTLATYASGAQAKGSGQEIASSVVCKSGQQKVVLFKGGVDGTSTGGAPASPRPQLAQTQYVQNYHARPGLGGPRQYDDNRENAWFIDSYTSFPAGQIASGTFLIGMKGFGGNDNFAIGDVAAHYDNGGQRIFGHQANQMTSAGWNRNGDVYSQRLSLISMRDGSTLRDLINNDRFVDISVQDDTKIDFTGLVLCVQPPRPTGPVASLSERLNCEREGLTKHVIKHGNDDLFAGGTESTQPRPSLANVPWVVNYHARPGLGGPRSYDDPRQNAWFIDTLSGFGQGSISDGIIMVGMRNFGGNDTIKIGDVAGQANGNHRYFDHRANQLANAGWQRMGDVYYTNLSSVIMRNGEPLSNYVNTASQLDIAVEDDTTVDFTAVAFCAKKGVKSMYGASVTAPIHPAPRVIQPRRIQTIKRLGTMKPARTLQFNLNGQ